MEPGSEEEELDRRLLAALEAYAAGERGQPAELVFQRLRKDYGLPSEVE